MRLFKRKNKLNVRETDRFAGFMRYHTPLFQGFPACFRSHFLAVCAWLNGALTALLAVLLASVQGIADLDPRAKRRGGLGRSGLRRDVIYMKPGDFIRAIFQFQHPHPSGNCIYSDPAPRNRDSRISKIFSEKKTRRKASRLVSLPPCNSPAGYSLCCGATMSVRGRTTRWHVCDKCGKPCDMQMLQTRVKKPKKISKKQDGVV